MKRKLLGFMIMAMVGIVANPSQAQDIWNPATGVYILQKGDLYPGDTAAGNLYYTRYADVNDRVKRMTYRYNGYGYFRIVDKDTIAKTNGADGIIHHPDGDLLIGAQGSGYVHKLNKTSRTVVSSVTDTNGRADDKGIYHLMMDPSDTLLWAAGIPGYLFKFRTTDAMPQHIGNGAYVPLTGSDTQICTIAWDERDSAFYTSSDPAGNGYFGSINMTTMKTTRIFSTTIRGAHGMSYDPYSKSIFLFGSGHIVQIDPLSKTIIADLDFNSSAMFSSIGHTFQFDQGTVDGDGHIYVADNNGYIVFIDYTSNPNKRIDDNILVHAQFLDNQLDDVAPLTGAGSEKKKTTTSSGSGFSSSSMFSSGNQLVSSSVPRSSSSLSSSRASSGGTGTSSGDTGTSSGGTGTSSGGTGTSSGGTGTSSGGTGTSSGGTGTSSGGTGTSSGGTGTSSGGTGTSSGGTGTSSGGTGTSSGGTGTSSGGTGTSSGGTGTSSAGGTGTSIPGNSSSAGGTGTSVPGGTGSSGSGTGEDIPPWADPDWDWGTGDSVPTGGDLDDYPSNDKREIADSVVEKGTVLVPVDPDDYDPDQVITIGNNTYLKTSTGDSIGGFTPGSTLTGTRDSIPLGSVLDLNLDLDKLKDYFGDDVDLVIRGSEGLQFVSPDKGGNPGDSITLSTGGTSNHLWILSDTAVAGGYITITGPDGKQLRYDGINFYDPIPFPEAGLLKDTDGDRKKDQIEVFLDRPIEPGYSVQSVDILYNGKTLTIPANKIHLNGDSDRVIIDVGENTDLSTYTVKDSDILKIHFQDNTGRISDREMPLKEVVQGIIARAVVIRSTSGNDSLFVEFNIDVTPTDLLQKTTLILLNGKEIEVDLSRQPGKRLVILESNTYVWNGKDSIQLHDLVSFDNLPYIIDEEYDRKVPVDILTRVPAFADGSGYFDSNGDGVMDSVVFHFDAPVTEEQLAMMHFSIPWQSYRNRQIYLKPDPTDLVIDPNDPTVVSWRVISSTDLRPGLTSLPAGMPPAEVYIEYPIFTSTFTEHRSFDLADLMSPAITEARIRYSEEGDTLKVRFSEAVDYSTITRKDIFKYQHGEKIYVLRPLDLIWSEDGKSVDIIMAHEQADPILPGDYLIIRGENGTGGMVIDNLGNVPLQDGTGFLIDGGLNQVVHTSNMGNLSRARMDTTKSLGSVSVQFVPNEMRASDLRDAGKVGQLIELGQRFMPQLVDQSGVSADSLDPEKVDIAISTYYFDNLGQYVTDTIIVLNCTHPSFGGNCLTTTQKVFIDWNFKDARGRFVGSGVYVANYTMYIRYDQSKAIKEERIEKVGVRRTK